MLFKISQLQSLKPIKPKITELPKQPIFNVADAVAYNTKSETYFKDHEPDIKRVIGTSDDWKSPEFASAVYDWQKNHGFSGKWIDGKFGPATMSKVASIDSVLGKVYDPYTALKIKHLDEKPYKRVVSLLPEVERIRNEMGANNIPLNMLMGWIQVESGGRVSDLTTSAGFREAGLFQVSEDEAKSINVDMDKLLQDRDYSIRAGILLARYHAQNLDKILEKYPNMKKFFPKDSDMYWRLAMFGFSAGDGTMSQLVQRMAADGKEFTTWDDVMKFAASNPIGFKHSPIKWTYHINRAFNLGNKATNNINNRVANINNRLKIAKRKARQIILNKLISKNNEIQ